MESVLNAEFVVATIREPVLVLDNDKRIISANAAFYKIFQVTPKDTLGHILYDVGNGQWDIPQLRMFLEDILPKSSVFNDFEVRYNFPKIGEKVMLLNARRLSQTPNAKPMILLAIEDITERKTLEEKNAEYSEHLAKLVEERTKEVLYERQRLYSVLETLPAMICLLTPDHYVTFANRSFRARFGESQGRYCYNYCFWNKKPCSFCESSKVLETGKPHHWEVPCPDGSVIDAYDFPFTDMDGSPLILEMDMDITEQKRTQASLRSASQYARSLIEAALDPLVTISADGKITDVNEATVEVTGFSREQLIGSDFSNYFTEPEKALVVYQSVFQKGFVRDYPLAIRHVSGKVTDVLYNATVYRTETGEIQGVFAAARDVTEHNVLERKLKESERLAAIGQTAGMVGHDIRNPLQSIEGAIYLGKDAVDNLSISNEEKVSVNEMFEAIEEQTKYINKIVSDLQDFARPLKPDFKETSSQQLIKNSLSNTSIPHNIEVSTMIEDNLPSLKLDPEMIRRVLVNLITNSVQAMPNGGKLTIRAFRKGKSVYISVQDTGIGIPEEVKPKIFQPMFTTKSKGQGFGLAVCKRIVEAHNGEIMFESEIGKGTVFTLQLPFL